MNGRNIEYPERERKTTKVYFWLEPSLLKYIDAECDKKMVSRSAYLRWVIIHFNENIISEIHEIYNEVVLKKRLSELTNQKVI